MASHSRKKTTLLFGLLLAEIGTEINVIAVDLAKYVKDFYAQRGMSICTKSDKRGRFGQLKDGQYHLFWNNEVPMKSPVDEMTLLLRDYARRSGKSWANFGSTRHLSPSRV